MKSLSFDYLGCCRSPCCSRLTWLVIPALVVIRIVKRGGTMSQLRLFSVLGDNNVVQNMTTLNMASRESMQKAQLISCPALRDLPSAIDQIRSEANVFLYAAITEHLLAAPEGNTIYSTVDPIFSEIRDSQLTHEYSLKVAADAEFSDWVENRADEDWMTVQGLPRLQAKDGSDWQVQVKRQIRDLVKQVQQVNRVNFSFEIVYVHNPLRKRTTGPTLYNVQLGSVETSRRIRELYSGFFRRNNPHKLPSNLKGIGIRNKVTIGTRIRVAIMRQLGANYKASNPGLLPKISIPFPESIVDAL